ncbi:hypothetical protein [Paenibacillus arenilitoris]|nr:hypothetical protein [Paenibacillus arenilitoris]
MDVLIVILLVIAIALLLRINAKLPGRDRAKEAVDRYLEERKKG